MHLSATGTGLCIELFRFPDIFAHIPVPESYRLFVQGILSGSNPFKTGILTGIHLSDLFKIRTVDQQKAGTGWTDRSTSTA